LSFYCHAAIVLCIHGKEVNIEQDLIGFFEFNKCTEDFNGAERHDATQDGKNKIFVMKWVVDKSRYKFYHIILPNGTLLRIGVEIKQAAK
jgi:hypothetical protein